MASQSGSPSHRPLHLLLLYCLIVMSVPLYEVVSAHNLIIPEVGQGDNAPILPPWPHTYNMSLSTIIQPCNDSGLFDISFGSSFGIADYDWSNAKAQWANTKPMNCEEMLVQQAVLNKAANNNSKTMVYRNLVKALPWFSSVREKLDDPQYSGFFLRFANGSKGHYHVPACDNNYNPPKCSDFYHDQEQTPQHPSGDGSCKDPCDCGKNPCGEYLWDHRNGSMLQDFLVNHYIGGMNGIDNPAIDGFFIDDGWSSNGPSEEDSHSIEDMGLSAADVKAIEDGWSANMAAVQKKILSSKGFNWQLLNCLHAPNATYTCHGAPQTAPYRNQTDPRADCTAWLREACPNKLHPLALMFGFTRVTHHQPLNKNGTLPALMQDLATFLLVRGDYAWIGYGWEGCGLEGKYTRPPQLDVDYGEPVDDGCKEIGSSGVFTREYTKASVKMDCNAWEGTITMK